MSNKNNFSYRGNDGRIGDHFLRFQDIADRSVQLRTALLPSENVAYQTKQRRREIVTDHGVQLTDKRLNLLELSGDRLFSSPENDLFERLSNAANSQARAGNTAALPLVAFGDVIAVVRSGGELLTELRRYSYAVHQYAAFCLVRTGTLLCAGDKITVAVGPGSVMLLDLAKAWRVDTGEEGDVTIFLTSRHGLAPLLHGGLAIADPTNAAMAMVVGLATSLLLLHDGLSDPQRTLAGEAIRHELIAFLLPLAIQPRSSSLARGANLFDRLVALLDQNPTGKLDLEALCKTLSCSRSALYRAAASSGGVGELWATRRLAAVYRRLLNPADTRPINAIAQEYGFTDPVRFSRRFKKAFGITASSARSRQEVETYGFDVPLFPAGSTSRSQLG